MASLRRRAGSNLAAQIVMMLHENAFSTVGYDTNSAKRMDRGFLQGCLLSPALSNVYIDELVEWSCEAEVNLKTVITLFTDDVVALKTSESELQEFLRVCEDWARASGMTWAMDKCFALL